MTLRGTYSSQYFLVRERKLNYEKRLFLENLVTLSFNINSKTGNHFEVKSTSIKFKTATICIYCLYYSYTLIFS
jgi:hypothetical protein